jgi:hypothetical protein
VVVRLDLESGAPTVAPRHDAGILAGRDNHAFARGRQTFEMDAG